MIDLNKKYKTRAGHPVELTNIITADEIHQVEGKVLMRNNCWYIAFWTIEGYFPLVSDRTCHLDLIEVKEEIV